MFRDGVLVPTNSSEESKLEDLNSGARAATHSGAGEVVEGGMTGTQEMVGAGVAGKLEKEGLQDWSLVAGGVGVRGTGD